MTIKNDITELAQLRAELSNPTVGSKDHLRKLALSLVEALEKAQKSNEFLKGQLSELANFNPDWDKLEASYESWREIAAELLVAKERIAELESRTVKLPDDEDGQAYGFGTWANGKLPATTGTMTIAYCEDAWRAAFDVFSSAAGIKWEVE